MKLSTLVQLEKFSPLSMLELPNFLKNSTGNYISEVAKNEDYVKSEKDIIIFLKKIQDLIFSLKNVKENSFQLWNQE